MFKQYHRYKIFLMLADVLLSVFILASVVELRTSLPGRAMDPQTVLPSMMIYVMQALLLNMVFVLTDMYTPERISRVTHHLGRFTSAYLLGVSVFAGLLFFTFRETSRLLVIYFSLTNYVALLSVRYALSAFLAWKRSGIAGVPVIVVGTLDNAVRVAENIIKDHSGVLRLVGFSDTVIPSQRSLPAPFLGHVNNLERIVREYNIEMVIIARTDVRSSEVEPLTLQPIIFQLERLPVRVYLAPDLFSLALVESEVERFGDLVLIGLRESVIRGAKRVRKRILDLVLCVLVLFFAWPIFIIVWILIRIDTPGPGIISVRRVGENGKIFKMYKFRSMIMGADQLQDKVITIDAFGEKVYKLKDDPRTTRVGRWIRRTSLDELPQIFNVLKGDMSCVGPRPEQPFITQLYDHWQWQRVSVPPGVTGWWQVSGRADLPMHRNTEYDVYYVKNYSILLDLKILFKTVIAIIKAKGAF